MTQRKREYICGGVFQIAMHFPQEQENQLIDLAQKITKNPFISHKKGFEPRLTIYWAAPRGPIVKLEASECADIIFDYFASAKVPPLYPYMHYVYDNFICMILACPDWYTLLSKVVSKSYYDAGYESIAPKVEFVPHINLGEIGADVPDIVSFGNVLKLTPSRMTLGVPKSDMLSYQTIITKTHSTHLRTRR